MIFFSHLGGCSALSGTSALRSLLDYTGVTELYMSAVCISTTRDQIHV